ncbi:MAG: type II toxin-antitoxin system CcdA family antitoxin [Thioclava sp.]|nr:type II toxin-antitoxin system CcdA family antitoxin [Thioclava sp.]MBD3805123.1 type II toxin-antitoxin system CcdA family antitoxin [Thioclava sp.]
MGLRVYDEAAGKQAANISINKDVLRQARELKLSVSRAAEERLVELIRAERERQLREELAESIQAYNEFVDEHGLFSDERRLF